MIPRTLAALVALSAFALALPQEPEAAPTAEASQQEAVDPALDAKLGDLLASVDTVAAMGKAADRELTRARRRLDPKTARPVLYVLGRRIRRTPAPDPGPEAEAVKDACSKVATLAGECVSTGAKGLATAAARIAKEEGLRKEITELVHRQLYDQVALTEMMGYLEGGQSPGVFDGMFPVTAGHGEAGTAACLRLLLDMDHPNDLRVLAGEGVAQLGKAGDKALLEELRRIQEDTMEERVVREKVKMVLARLGDRKLFDAELAQLQGTWKEREAAAARIAEEFAALVEKQKALPADADEAQKKEVAESLQNKRSEHINALFGLGASANALANHFQGLRTENGTTADWYRKNIDTWSRIGGVIWNNANAKRAMSFAWYNLACVMSLDGKKEGAMHALENSLRWGYDDLKWARRDGDLRDLRKGEAFEKLLKEVESGEAQKRWAAEAKAQREAAEKKAAEARKKAAAEGDAGGSEKPPAGPTGDGADG